MLAMNLYKKQIEIRWSDLDPNFHLRHSVYYDWGAFVRISYLYENNITSAVMNQYHFGPILFREECIFKREIVFGDKVEVDLMLRKCRRDMSRWTMIHKIWKNNDTPCAIVTVDGAWIDTKLRKLTIPPSFILNGFDKIPHSPEFEWIEVV